MRVGIRLVGRSRSRGSLIALFQKLHPREGDAHRWVPHLLEVFLRLFPPRLWLAPRHSPASHRPNGRKESLDGHTCSHLTFHPTPILPPRQAKDVESPFDSSTSELTTSAKQGKSRVLRIFTKLAKEVWPARERQVLAPTPTGGGCASTSVAKAGLRLTHGRMAGMRLTQPPRCATLQWSAGMAQRQNPKGIDYG